MTDVTPTITPLRSALGLDGYIVEWDAIGYNASPNVNGVAYSNVHFSDRSIHVTGTFGAGGHVKLFGSNDNTNWFVLNDPSSTALDFSTTNTGKAVLELTRYFRPTVTAGDGSTAINVILLLGGKK